VWAQELVSRWRCFFAAGTEAGFISLLFLFIPLYTRIKKEQALDHFVRGQVYEYIKMKPGQHYNAIREHLGLKNGTLAYHLKTLEMQNFIKYRRVGLFKCFYPVDYTFPRGEVKVKLSKLQRQLLNAIESKPGLTQTELIEQFGESQQSVSYNIKTMERNGVIRSESEGRTVHYYPVPQEPQNN
jgi:predicted transcriptional regulator